MEAKAASICRTRIIMAEGRLRSSHLIVPSYPPISAAEAPKWTRSETNTTPHRSPRDTNLRITLERPTPKSMQITLVLGWLVWGGAEAMVLAPSLFGLQAILPRNAVGY
ncbi:uncharacterized protein BDR25DRAFT_90762 [Lindgomyces ingoldianus]|uniref:Uncharacterized protein n=1 Tax=Lindgomyces ingoldianus TaxID=673940 RepID=A0ACB6RA29_9PLEO|nr:uncharacterized protein BDR25DRAFT_90762 [Lindgomyces ingoldianus]KAF2476128.1 hypothetical protein BDR25DRAFT_90762 [Lindgomyces ingoldianus]